MELSILRRTAAEILAAAVYETFPQVGLLGGSYTSFGFYYDFHFPHPVHPELHLQIEEKMRQIVREKREIQDLEMVAVSAKEFLKSRGMSSRAEQIEGKGLFSILQMGSFVDLSSGSHLKNSAEASSFKLFTPVLLENQVMRILGTAFGSKDALKDFLKKWSGYPARRHEKIGEIRQFWSPFEEGFVWFSEGIRARDGMIRQWKENVARDAFELSCPRGADRRDLHQKLLGDLKKEMLVEVFPIQGHPYEVEEVGFFDPVEGTEIQITTSLKNVISCLQSIGKTLSILGFNYCIRLTPPRRKGRAGPLLEEALKELQWAYESSEEEREASKIDFLVADGIGRQWSAVRVEAKESLSCHIIVERNLALLLEMQ